MKKPKPRTANMPRKVTAHSVRGLTRCTHCLGMGSRELMIEGKLHTRCAVELLPISDIRKLPYAELAKVTIGDLMCVSSGKRQAIIDAYDH